MCSFAVGECSELVPVPCGKNVILDSPLEGSSQTVGSDGIVNESVENIFEKSGGGGERSENDTSGDGGERRESRASETSGGGGEQRESEASEAMGLIGPGRQTIDRHDRRLAAMLHSPGFRMCGVEKERAALGIVKKVFEQDGDIDSNLREIYDDLNGVRCMGDSHMDARSWLNFDFGGKEQFGSDGRPADELAPEKIPWDPYFSRGLQAVPSHADWANISASMLEPQPISNPPGWNLDDPFIGGCVTDVTPAGDAVSVADWDATLPRMATFVRNIIINGGVRLVVDGEPEPMSAPDYNMDSKGLRLLIHETSAGLKMDILRLVKTGSSLWVSPQGTVDKSEKDEDGDFMKRLIFDMVGNDSLELWHQHFEGTKFLPAIACKGYVVATIDVKKGYWTIRVLNQELLGTRIRLRPAWILEVLRVASSRLGAQAALDDLCWQDWEEVDMGDQDPDSGKWEIFEAVFTVLPMGVKPSGALFVTIMRQFVHKWRNYGASVHGKSRPIRHLHWVDDFLFAAEDSRSLLRDLWTVVADLWRCNVPIGFRKCAMGHLVDNKGQIVPAESAVLCDALGDRVEGRISFDRLALGTPCYKDLGGKLLEYRGMSIVKWLGNIHDFGKGRSHPVAPKVKTLLELLEETRHRICVSRSPVIFLTLAQICGRLGSMRGGLIPAVLMTRSMYSCITCTTAEEYREIAEINPTVTEEIVFWSFNLVTFARLGGPMFPDTDPFTLEVVCDAGPRGWGAKASRKGGWNISGRYDSSAGSESINIADAFHTSDQDSDQVLRELRGHEEILLATIQSKRVTLVDRRIKLKFTSEEAAIWAQYGPRVKFSATEDEKTALVGDCRPALKYLQQGGGRSKQLQEVSVRIWSLCMQHCIKLEVFWASGDSMIKMGVDGLGRQKWAPEDSWLLGRTARRLILGMIARLNWNAKNARIKFLGPRAIRHNVMEWMHETVLSVERPGRGLLGWTSNALACQRTVVVIVPLWHGPEMVSVRLHSVERQVLGPARICFSSKQGILPSWLMVAHACIFRPDANSRVPPIIPEACGLPIAGAEKDKD